MSNSIGPKNPPPGALPTLQGGQPAAAEQEAGAVRLRDGGALEGAAEVEEKEVEEGLDEHQGDFGKASKKRAKLIGQTRPVIPTAAAKQGRGLMNLRLANLSGERLNKGGLSLDDGPAGRTLTADVVVQAAADLQRLVGVTELKGNLEILESAVSAADLQALKGLKVVEGNLVLEGNRAVTALDALAKLERVEGNLYAGYNDALDTFALPALKAVGGALILEGNLRLTKVDAPALGEVGRYLHLHENDVLVEAHFGQLKSLERELSILDNPKLVLVSLPQLTAHDDVEIADNGAERLGGLTLAH